MVSIKTNQTISIMPSIKAIILIGGPNKGQRFRPLSFDSPKYMFPVGGQTILGHLIDSCLNLVVSDSDLDLVEILILGFYQQDGVDYLSQNNLQKLVKEKLKNIGKPGDSKIQVRYLQEFTRMGTAGGLYHFRDQIRRGNPDAFLLINGDVCGDFDFDLMFSQHQEITAKVEKEGETPFAKKPIITVMTTEASRSESQSYGCIVENPKHNHVIEHYVEKPSTFVSNLINCGAYVCSLELLNLIESVMLSRNPDSSEETTRLSATTIPNSDSNNLSSSMSTSDYLSLELDILQQRKFQPHCYSYRTGGSWWCQVKTAASAIYANRQCLGYKSLKINGDTTSGNKEQKCTIIGNVYIHPSAVVDASSVIGPNVSIMGNCVIGPGVRVKESIILQSAVIDAHSLIMCSIVGWNCVIGSWVRVEGTPSEPDPNQKFAKVQNPPLFNPNGKLNPSITVLGSSVKISRGIVILNTIVLPHKELGRSYKNEIVL